MDYQKIIQQIKGKDPAGLLSLYEAYGEKFYAYCVKRWSLSEDAAWEVVYRTMETLLLKGAAYHFESEQHFNNFLFKVLINFLRQEYRKSQASKIDLEFVDLNNEEAMPHGLHVRMNQAAFEEYYRSDHVDSPMLTGIKEALKMLDPIDRDMLLLRAQNYSYDEIAALLRIENNQLKVKHHRAKQKLTNLLKNSPHATQQ
jgi:RNA polymerase sigma-70 factor (ECF subfamily)